MRLAAVIPIGPLDRYGYQNVAAECIYSWAAFADAVYLVSSTPDDYPAHFFELGADNVILISDERTWFDGGVYDYRKLNDNVMLGCWLAQETACDIAVLGTCNSYVPENHAGALRDDCEKLLRSGAGIGWLYRGDQLGGRLYAPGKRLPYLLNLNRFPEARAGFAPDEAFDGANTLKPEYGDFADYEPQAIIDAPFELTLDELADKMNFIRCYHDLQPKRNPVFDWGFWKGYHLAKYQKKHTSAAALSPTGQAIAARHRPEFVSAELLKEL